MLVMSLFFLNHYERLVWVDESWVGTWMARTHGWSKRGKRIRCVGRARVPANTLICAMGAKGVLCHQVFPKGTTRQRWKAFVLGVLLERLPRGCIVIWDNLRVHKDGECLAVMEEAGHLVMFTPPYSPEGSPIEYLFNTLKAKLKAIGATTMASLREAVDTILESVSPQHVAGYSMIAWGHIISWKE